MASKSELGSIVVYLPFCALVESIVGVSTLAVVVAAILPFLPLLVVVTIVLAVICDKKKKNYYSTNSRIVFLKMSLDIT